MDGPVQYTMKKLITFDLDNTLAPIGEPIARDTLKLLHKLADTGVQIAVASGKPTYYLCGLLRQAGLPDTILIGENGAMIEFGVGLPPSRSVTLPYSDAARKSIRFIREELRQMLPHLWYQPNRVALTPFFRCDSDADSIERFLHENSAAIRDVTVYRQCDCFDIVPNGIDKGAGLSYLCGMLGITADDVTAVGDGGAVIAVGDGTNDYPMFDFAGVSIGINVADKSRVDYNFGTITDALLFILNLI